MTGESPPQVKQSDPQGHLTASQALAIAKDYILEKAPGLLEEHGGHVKLKLTWAMKLVQRIGKSLSASSRSVYCIVETRNFRGAPT